MPGPHPSRRLDLRRGCRLSGRLLLLAGASFIPLSAAAQQPGGHDSSGFYHDSATPRWIGHFTVLSANALLGALTAGVFRRARGGSFQEGFTRGALGGAVVYVGKRVAVEEWAGAGLAGRQFAAVGASLVRNPADGRAPLEELMLPLGPVRLYLSTGQRIALRPRVDLHNLFWTTYGLVDPALRLDPGATLSAGAPVFRAADRGLVWKQTGTRARGLALGGAIFLDGTPEAGGPGMDHVFAHERVHVLQTDQVFHTLFAPLESWLLGSLPEGQRLTRIVDLNLVLPALGYFLLAGGDYGAELPWEMEAYFLVPYRWSDGH